MGKLNIISEKMKNKTIIITGASSPNGIGKKIVTTLYKHSANVVITAFNNIKLLDQFDELCDEDKILKLRLDVKCRGSIKRVVTKTIEKFGKIDILVNNAGQHQVKPFLEITDDDWDNIMNTNLKGAWMMSQECIPHMVKNSKIINIGSIAGVTSGYEAAHYAISKAGIIGLTRTLARCFPNIQSNCVAPSLIKTDMANGLKCDNKIGYPKDVANTILFLSSSDSDFITGQTINVNGGLYFE